MLFLLSPEIILVRLRLGLTRRRSVTGILYLNEEDIHGLLGNTMSHEAKAINLGIDIVNLGEF